MYESMNEYRVRTYEKGDETELARLFNEAYQAYAGFVPRTPEYWRWSCLDRPDVEKEGIVIVVHARKIVGYAVVGKSGNIWELCFDRGPDQERVGSLILDKAVDYLTRVGSDSVTLNLPSKDSVARQACERLGFSQLPPEIPFLSVLDFERLLGSLYSANQQRLMDFEGSFLIKFQDGPFWITPFVSMRVRNGGIDIASQKELCQAVIETDTRTLTSVLFGTEKALSALLRLKLKIRPLRELRTVLRLFSLLRVKEPWFVPGADLG